MWERYLHYLQAASKLSGDGVDQQNLARTKEWLAQRSALRKQLLQDVALTWFGAEEAADQEQMGRLEIVADRSLTPVNRSKSAKKNEVKV